MPQQNLDLLQDAAQKLESLLSEVVFVGGCVTDVLITDAAAPETRLTNDVDVIAEIATYADYTVIFAERLRALGFHEDTSPRAPLCRWLHGSLILDVMSPNPKILGFSNVWYGSSIQTATATVLANGLQIRVIDAPHFLATKFEAFRSRGRNDIYMSHDLEDLIAVVDGRSTLVDEVARSPQDLVDYLRQQFNELLAHPDFAEALPGFLPSDRVSRSRLPNLEQRLRSLAA
jgi:predicted nucleotidyltransferase